MDSRHLLLLTRVKPNPARGQTKSCPGSNQILPGVKPNPARGQTKSCPGKKKKAREQTKSCPGTNQIQIFKKKKNCFFDSARAVRKPFNSLNFVGQSFAIFKTPYTIVFKLLLTV
jgi:hypothetical protein